jgi:hypothetical protein
MNTSAVSRRSHPAAGAAFPDETWRRPRHIATAWPGALVLLLASCASAPEREAAPAAPAATAEARAVAVVAFTEGPAVDAGGSVYFTELRFPRILKYTPGQG